MQEIIKKSLDLARRSSRSSVLLFENLKLLSPFNFKKPKTPLLPPYFPPPMLPVSKAKKLDELGSEAKFFSSEKKGANDSQDSDTSNLPSSTLIISTSKKLNELYYEIRRSHLEERGYELQDHERDLFIWGSKDRLKYILGIDVHGLKYLDEESDKETLILAEYVGGAFHAREALMMTHDQGGVIVGERIFYEAFTRNIKSLTHPKSFQSKEREKIISQLLDEVLDIERESKLKKDLEELDKITYITRGRDSLFLAGFNKSAIVNELAGVINFTKDQLDKIVGPKTANLIMSYCKMQIANKKESNNKLSVKKLEVVYNDPYIEYILHLNLIKVIFITGY